MAVAFPPPVAPQLRHAPFLDLCPSPSADRALLYSSSPFIQAQVQAGVGHATDWKATDHRPGCQEPDVPAHVRAASNGTTLHTSTHITKITNASVAVAVMRGFLADWY